jgi:L-ribulokinase
MRALAAATRQAVNKAGIRGDQLEAIALDTTGSSVVPVGKGLVSLGDYYLWCDHHAKNGAAEITERAHKEGLEAIQWCGGVYSSEWGFAKLRHWLRHSPDQREKFVTAPSSTATWSLPPCAALRIPHRSNAAFVRWPQVDVESSFGRGLPPESFLIQVDPLLARVRAKLDGTYATSDQIDGHLSPFWAEKASQQTLSGSA